MTHRRPSSGMSLIEVLVAMALVLVLVAGAAGMMTLALRAKRRGDIIAAVAHAVEDRLATLRTLPFDDPALAAGSHAATRSAGPGRIAITERWDVADAEGGLKRIRLAVREAGRDGPETVAILLVSRDLGFGP